MNKRRMLWIEAVSIVVILVLTLFVGHTIHSVQERIRQSCFDDLTVASKQLAGELNTVAASDHTTLSAIATIIANQENLTDSELCRIISSYDFGSTYISYLEILKPEGAMLFADGTALDMSDRISFADEVRKGENISGIHQSKRYPETKVVRQAVPVVRNGETVYILYGVVRLTDLAEMYTTDLYGGHAYVYIVDGDTGDFILDTWHKTMGNIIELGKRETLPGYSLDQTLSELRNGIGGKIAFVSKTTGSVLFMRYEPLNVNNWNVMITVEEEYAMAKSRSISASLYLMAGGCGIIFLLFFAFVVANLFDAYRQVRKMSREDQNTGLLNRNAYEQYVADSQRRAFPSVACVYIDANELHRLNNERGHSEGDKMLRTVADALRREYAANTVYRIGGDEFVVLTEAEDESACGEKMGRVVETVEGNGYSISYGIVGAQNETGLERIIRKADARMLKAKGAYYAKHDRRRG